MKRGCIFAFWDVCHSVHPSVGHSIIISFSLISWEQIDRSFYQIVHYIYIDNIQIGFATHYFQKILTELCPSTAVRISPRIDFPLRLIEFDQIL